MSDITSLIVYAILGEFILLGPFAIFVRLGGYPEGYYRLLKIRYFGFVLYDPDGTPLRRVKKSSSIITKSPPHFNYSFKGADGAKISRTFYIDKPNAERFRGRPQWRYTQDNALPIPIFTGKVSISLENGTTIERTFGEADKKLEPRAIFKAYNTDIPSDLLKLGQDKPKKGPNWLLIGGVALGGLIAMAIGFYLLAHGGL